MEDNTNRYPVCACLVSEWNRLVFGQNQLYPRVQRWELQVPISNMKNPEGAVTLYAFSCNARNIAPCNTPCKVRKFARKVAETVTESRTRFCFLLRFQATFRLGAQSNESFAKCKHLSRNGLREKLHETCLKPCIILS